MKSRAQLVIESYRPLHFYSMSTLMTYKGLSTLMNSLS